VDAQNKSREKTDAHRHSSKLGRLKAEMLSIVPGEGTWWSTSCCYWLALPLERLTAKETLNALFAFFH